MEHLELLTHVQALNRSRKERLNELSPSQQQPFFDLLPLLFHLNSPELPGYIEKNAPVGIIDYQPEKSQLNAAKKLHPRFHYRRRALRSYPIIGLYLINNDGLINYQNQSRFELLLVHATDLTDAKQQALQYKLMVISQWAASFGIAITTRLLAENTLTQQPFSSYELDRFYLNGLIIAGAVPLWWFIPPDTNYHDGAPSLLEQRMLHVRLVDFGDVPLTPASAQPLFDEGVKLLENSIEQGITHALPLLHLQYHLQQYPDLPWLSSDLKQAIYQGESEPLQVDCRSIQLWQLERADAPAELLRLARQSFYIQTKERLSQTVDQPKLAWRRPFVKTISQSWQWRDQDFKLLDQRNNASYQQCLLEHQLTSPIFKDISTTLNTFAKQQRLIINPQYQLIDRKLKRLIDDHPDTIRPLPEDLLAKHNEEHLYLYRFEADGDWKISNITLSSPTQTPLHQGSSLLNILAWAICNQVLTRTSRIRVSDSSQAITITTVLPLIQQLLASPLAEPVKIMDNALLQVPELMHVLLFANLGQQPMAKLSQQGLKLSSLKNDPLHYANRGESLIISIDGLICSSWGEWHTFEHTGKTAPIDMLTTLIHWWNAEHKEAPSFHCWSPSDIYSHIISDRLEKLYMQVSEHYHNFPSSGDYLLVIADTFYQLQWQSGSCDITPLTQISDVLAALGKPRTHFSASKVDASLDPTGLFTSLLKHQADSQLSLFLHSDHKSISIYILDELGGLFQQTYTNISESTLTKHFYRFLGSLKDQKKLSRLRFFSIENNHRGGEWQSRALALPNSSDNQGYLPVTVTMDNLHEDSPCTISCGSNQFVGKANDISLFEQVSKLMSSLRKANNDYALYITELNFTHSAAIPTRNYIQLKQQLEKRLNTG